MTTAGYDSDDIEAYAAYTDAVHNKSDGEPRSDKEVPENTEASVYEYGIENDSEEDEESEEEKEAEKPEEPKKVEKPKEKKPETKKPQKIRKESLECHGFNMM